MEKGREIDEQQDDAEKIDYIEFLRTTKGQGQRQGQFRDDGMPSDSAQNKQSLLKAGEQITALNSPKSLPHIKVQTNKSGNINSTICNDKLCTMYEAISSSSYLINNRSQECATPELAAPSTVSTLPSILRPPKWWHKQNCYSLDSLPKQVLDDMEPSIHADLLRMPTICSPLVGASDRYGSRANNYQNKIGNRSKRKD
uniref:Uncharacterized protein n=1 Tax=Setaria digitata TaxID=48799 RepID=A0A915PKC7_9BILA